MAVSLRQDPAQKWEAIVFTSRRWMCFVSDGNVKAVGKYLRETRT